MSTEAAFAPSDVSRYSEIYLDDREEEVSTFNPITMVYGLIDDAAKFKGNIFICNREPNDVPFKCECPNKANCACDGDECEAITFSCEVVSNCRCNVDIALKGDAVKLSKDFHWNVFSIDEKDNEVIFMIIDPIDSCFYINADGKWYKYDVEAVNNKKGIVSFQFSYMEYELLQ